RETSPLHIFLPAHLDSPKPEWRANGAGPSPGVGNGPCGAEGGTRTPMRLPSTVFETVASAIPPLRPDAYCTGAPTPLPPSARPDCASRRLVRTNVLVGA